MRRPRPVSIPTETRSTTSSNSSRLSRRYGPARVTRPNSSSSPTPSPPLAAASATICWARMSSGCSGGWRASRRPRLTAASSAADSTSSSRVVGYTIPRGTPVRWWLARPTRCRKVAMLWGEPIWHTSSTGPTSMHAVDNGGERLARSHQQAGRRLDRLHRRREADTDGRTPGDGLEPLEREREVRAALVAGQGVDLVEDDRLHRGEGGPRPFGGQVQVQRLGRGDEQVRGPADHHLPLPRGGIAGPHRDGDRCRFVAELPGHLGDLGERLLEVGVDVDGEGLQRAQVHDPSGALDGFAGLVGAVEGVDRGEEPGERLARAGGGADQRVPAGGDRRPAPALGLGRSAGKPPLKPPPYRRMEPLEDPGRSGDGGHGWLRSHRHQSITDRCSPRARDALARRRVGSAVTFPFRTAWLTRVWSISSPRPRNTWLKRRSAGISGARFHSRAPSPWSGRSKPGVPISEPGGPRRIWVVAAVGSSLRSPSTSSARSRPRPSSIRLAKARSVTASAARR